MFFVDYTYILFGCREGGEKGREGAVGMGVTGQGASSVLNSGFTGLKVNRIFSSKSCVTNSYVPTSDITISVLYAVAEGCKSPKEVYQYLLGVMNVPNDLSVRRRFYDFVRKCFERLCKAGYIRRVRYGVYAVTEKGIAFLRGLGVTHVGGKGMSWGGGGLVGGVSCLKSSFVSSIVSSVDSIVREVVRGGRVHFVCVKGWGVRKREKWYGLGCKFSPKSKQSVVEVATRFGVVKVVHSNTTGTFLAYFTAYNPVTVRFAVAVIDHVLNRLYREYVPTEFVRCEYSEFNGQKELWKYMEDNRIVMIKIYRSRKTRSVHIEIDFEGFVLKPLIEDIRRCLAS